MELPITYYFLLFFIYSCAGWLLEGTCKLIDQKKFVNRGFLIGPYCPIYGCGAILITVFLNRYAYDPVVLFVMTVVVCGILEYLTSYFMELLFRARWWDYSKRMFNLNGRICLGTIVPFGIFGMFLIYVSNPSLIALFNKIDINILNMITYTFLGLIAIDGIVSITVILGFRKTAIQVGKSETQDSTEQITKKVREILSQKSWGYKRLIEAFPNLETIKFRIQEITDEVKENARELKDNINEKAQDVKNTINDKKQEMKENFTEKGKAFSTEFQYQKRKAKINLKLNKRKIKRFWTKPL